MDRSPSNLSRRRLVAAAAGTTLAATIGSTKAVAAPATVDSRRALGSRPGGAYRDAALASAVHESLSALLPDSPSALDAALATTLGRVPAGPARDQGLAAGRAEARALLASRAGDGLETAASVNPPFPTPAPAPGIWQPTPSAFTTRQQAGSRFATPFLLTSALRTPAQADTATSWLGSSLVLYTGVLRAAVAQSPRGAAWRARLVALFHLALVDTQIATSDAKYAYLRWRPVTAIRATEDPAWTPFHATPAHPDYPSGRNTYSGAAEQGADRTGRTAFAGAVHDRQPEPAGRHPHVHVVEAAQRRERRRPSLVGHPHPRRRRGRHPAGQGGGRARRPERVAPFHLTLPGLLVRGWLATHAFRAHQHSIEGDRQPDHVEGRRRPGAVDQRVDREAERAE
jgi:hypothetical protein